MKLRSKERDMSINWWNNVELKTWIEDQLFPMTSVLGQHMSMSVAFVQSQIDRLKPKDVELAKKCAGILIEDWIKTRSIDVSEMNRATAPSGILLSDDSLTRTRIGGLSIPVTPDGDLALPNPEPGWTPLR